MLSRLSILNKEVLLHTGKMTKLPSHIDFGKIKYVGLFTTEQVEDVKTLVTTIASVLVSMKLSFPKNVFYAAYLAKLFGKYHTENRFYYCFDTGKDFLTNIYTIFGLLLVPLNQFLIYPIFN